MKNDYRSRINRVVDYIETHLHKELTLEELAAIAHFSKFHFHRIFISFTGETLFRFIQRLRLEKAASLLVAEPDLPVTEIALSCGFSGSASFARAFKEHFSCSASEWRREKLVPQTLLHADSAPAESSGNSERSNVGKNNSNIGIQGRKERKASPSLSRYIEYKQHIQIWRIPMENETRTVQVKELPDMTLAYIRYVGPYKGDGALFERLWDKLCSWAGPRGLINPPETRFLSIYHDNPELTEEDKLRTSVCISVPPDTEVSGEVGKMDIPGGKYAMARFELGEKDYQEAWDWVYGTWLPESGYVPDDRPPFELYPQEGSTEGTGECTGEKKHTVDICIPVKPME